MSRPSGPVVVVHAHCLSATVTSAEPGHVPGTSAPAGSAPAGVRGLGLAEQRRAAARTVPGSVAGVRQAVAFDAPKLLVVRETKAPEPSGQRANAPAPKPFVSSAPACPAV